MHGALLVDKPSGPTSHDIVALARRALKTRAIGHTGTLDPLATGLLVLLVGHATRLSQFLVTDEKEYLADIRLGQSTPTYDAQGLGSDRGQTGVRPGSEQGQTGVRPGSEQGQTGVRPGSEQGQTPSPERLAAVLAQFLGTFPQLPPPYSAKKIAGERAYKKARRNERVELKPVEVTVKELDVLSERRASHLAPGASDPTLVRLRIVCSAGFYVRSLAHDLGQLLGCGAHLEALRRTRAGQFTVADALSLEALEEDEVGDTIGNRLVSPNTLLSGMAAVTPTDEGLRRAWNGNTLGPAHLQAPGASLTGEARVRVLSRSGELLAVADRRSDGLLHPLVVLR